MAQIKHLVAKKSFWSGGIVSECGISAAADNHFPAGFFDKTCPACVAAKKRRKGAKH